MDEADIQKYASVMKEIKLRMEVISLFSSGQRNAHYVPTTIETVGLQFRKIFELIAMSSLAANREQYSVVYSDFEKHWEAAKLIKNVSKINPNFYPTPVVEVPSGEPGIRLKHKKREQDYLTQDELVVAHGRCGALMHAANPFGKPIEYDSFQRKFPVWATRIVNLLNNHEVRLPGDPGMWVFHMKEDGHDDVKWYRFEPPAESANRIL